MSRLLIKLTTVILFAAPTLLFAMEPSEFQPKDRSPIMKVCDQILNGLSPHSPTVLPVGKAPNVDQCFTPTCFAFGTAGLLQNIALEKGLLPAGENLDGLYIGAAAEAMHALDAITLLGSQNVSMDPNQFGSAHNVIIAIRAVKRFGVVTESMTVPELKLRPELWEEYLKRLRLIIRSVWLRPLAERSPIVLNAARNQILALFNGTMFRVDDPNYHLSLKVATSGGPTLTRTLGLNLVGFEQGHVLIEAEVGQPRRWFGPEPDPMYLELPIQSVFLSRGEILSLIHEELDAKRAVTVLYPVNHPLVGDSGKGHVALIVGRSANRRFIVRNSWEDRPTLSIPFSEIDSLRFTFLRTPLDLK